ncbi:MAG: hypothetical protein IPM03_10220 [Sulfuritalea sp.]|nr:hypothetical protein [Sulfuritalea sp.]
MGRTAGAPKGPPDAKRTQGTRAAAARTASANEGTTPRALTGATAGKRDGTDGKTWKRTK